MAGVKVNKKKPPKGVKYVMYIMSGKILITPLINPLHALLFAVAFSAAFVLALDTLSYPLALHLSFGP